MRNLLVGPSGEMHIEPKVMQVFEYLARSAGEVVAREELLEELWGGRSQSDEPLTRCIATLRRVLDDSAKDPAYIQTIPKRGYRLVCPVEPLKRPENAGSAERTGIAKRRAPGVGMVVALFLVVASIVAYLYVGNKAIDVPHVTASGAVQGEPPARSIAVLPFANLSPDPEDEYLSDGLAAELLNQLSKVRA